MGRRTHHEDPALHAGQPLDARPVHPADQPLQGLAGERTLDIVGQKIQFPKSFEKLKITASIVKDNMHCLKSFDSLVNMMVSNKSSIEIPPKVEQKQVSWQVNSENTQELKYKVVIAEKGPLSRKYKNESFKNFLYKCQCKSKQVGFTIFL